VTTTGGGERRQTPLARELAREIAATGSISIHGYMERCLCDPQHGYYTTRSGIGQDGDFTTAPEISQVFGELIGLWCAVVWQQMGAPARVNLVELGPGRGALIADALRAARILPGFLDAIDLHLCEINPAFRDLQADKLKKLDPPIEANWHDAWPSHRSQPTIVIANEFLDTVPGSQWTQDPVGEWQEIRIGLDDKGSLAFIQEHGQPPFHDDPALPPLPEIGAVFTHTNFKKLAGQLSVQSVDAPLAALFIDYGHTSTAWGDTLQAVRGHQIEEPLCSPGEADLSLAIDFAAFKRAVERAGLSTDGPIMQAEFLGQLGITERASKLMAANPARANEIETAILRLMSSPGMGNRFQAVGVRSQTLGALPGFATSSA
jgi:NADH dehydrogenase [ubiquinone] 1 alpha subcomplex assembly factor 7